MEFIEITWQSQVHQQEIQLRHRLLRKPLGLTDSPEQLAAEVDQLRFGILDTDGKLIACVLVVPLNETSAQLRQMAVSESLQGQGVGRQLLEQVHAILAARGFESLQLHARQNAIGFYENLGYAGEGDEFIEVGIAHLKMVRSIP